MNEPLNPLSINYSSAGLMLLALRGNIIFKVNNGEEIMRLSENGMTYKGVLIEDAGDAHRAFLEAMNRTKATP